MLHIHFAPEDLTRVAIASSPDVLWEILLGLHAVQDQTDELPFNKWRRRTRGLLTADLRPLLEMAPPLGYSADFLTPTRGQSRLDEGLEAVRATSRTQLDSAFRELSRQQRKPLVVRASGGSGSALPRELAAGLERFFAIALAPYWRQVTRDIEADRTQHIRTLGEHGVARMLETLHPDTRWRHPVLEVDGYVDQQLRLRGRGLILVPSFFCRRRPMVLKDPELPPVLIVPVRHRTWLSAEGHADPPLADLLGRTRTTVLEMSVHGCSTTEVARAAGITAGSVSHHTKVLRESGLITTHRDGQAVCHQITDLGRTLLQSPTAPQSATPDSA